MTEDSPRSTPLKNSQHADRPIRDNRDDLSYRPDLKGSSTKTKSTQLQFKSVSDTVAENTIIALQGWPGLCFCETEMTARDRRLFLAYFAK